MVEDNFGKDEDKDFSQKYTGIKNKVQKLANQYGNSLRFISCEQEAEYFNAWRYVIEVNVIPADTRNKRPTVEWRQYQNTPISKEQHESWKLQNAFKNGMAIIAGKVWHNAEKNNLFLILVDLDNQKAIDEFCTRNGVVTPLLVHTSQNILASSNNMRIKNFTDIP